MTSSEFEELRHQACELTADLDMNNELPRIERSLYQLRDTALKMASKAPIDGSDLKASLLLGSRGYDVSKASEKLESLNRLNNFGPLEPIQDVDIKAYLKNEYQNALVVSVQQTSSNTFEEASSKFWKSRETEWHKHKHETLLTFCDLSTDATSFPLDKSLNNTIMYSNDYSRLPKTSSSHQAYDDVICRYNEQVMQGDTQISLVDMYKQVAVRFDDQVQLEMWTLMSHLVQVRDRASCSQVVQKSLESLEKSYLVFMENMVSSNLLDARMGGVPGKFNLIISYFNARKSFPFKGSEDGLLEGHPVWAVIYQCLRCGDDDAIATAMHKSRKLIGDFVNVLEEYKSSKHRLSVTSQREVRLMYRRTVGNCSDPFKRLVYCVVGKCDPHDDHSDVIVTTDDYMWLKLSMVEKEEEDEDGGRGFDMGSGRLKLAQLQSLLLEKYGESHFNAHQQPLLYSKILLLIGQWESCIEFLWRFEPHRHLAVHLACTLHVHGLLLLPSNYHTHLLSKESGESTLTYRLNLVHLINTFNSIFENNEPYKALHHYYLLRSIKTLDSESNMFVYSLCQLCVSTRDYDLILGQTQSDGTRTPGLIDRFKVDVDKVIEKVALEVESQGQMIDAVRLYDLAKKQDKVLDLLVQLLSQVVTQPSKPRVDQLKKMAMEFAKRTSHKLPPSPSLTSFHILLDLSLFFQTYHAKNYKEAYDIIRELNLISLSPSTLDSMIRKTQTGCKEVRKCLPEVFLATAHCISQLCKQLSSTTKTVFSKADDASKKNLLKEYRQQMQSLVSFSGSMTSRMPSHVTAQLVSLEASIK